MNIKGKEFSEETIALALEAYVLGHPEPKPELRHGDYGYDWNEEPALSVAIQPAIDIIGKYPYPIRCASDLCAYDYKIHNSNFEIQNILGNIFDDLARNKVDLEKFEITTHHGGTLRMRIDDTIEFLVHNGHHATASLAEAIELYQKLGQMIATAKRKTK